jgi:diketogulonate reductase-like aldo/keto reductase
LRDGTEIPQIGLGVRYTHPPSSHCDLLNTISQQVYEMDEEEAEQAVYWALEAGYRHIDSAEWYVCLIRSQRVSYLSIDPQVRE